MVLSTPKWTQTIVPPNIIYRPGKAQVPDALKKLQQRLKNIEDIENTQ